MQMVVEVGGWEHECCGPPYERDSLVTLTCLVVTGPDGAVTRYVESHHDLATQHKTLTVHGRVADLQITHSDGAVEAIKRLPSGSALCGFDDADDGHLEQPWTGQPVTNDSDQYVVSITS